MRKLLGALLAVMMLVSACGGKQDEKPAAGSAGTAQSEAKQPDGPGVTSNTVKIGAWIPLTGPAAAYGVPLKLGYDAYFKVINDKGGVNGRKIEFIVEDTDRDPGKTVAGARKLVERDQVFALVGTFGVAQTAATFSFVLDEAKVPMVQGYGGAMDWFNPVKPYLFGLQVVYEDQARALGRWMAKEGAKRILIVHNDPAAYENVAKSYQPGAATVDPNIKVDLMSVKLGTRDYVPIVLQIIDHKPDAIGFVGDVHELTLMAKELARQNVKIPLYTYGANVSQDTISLGGEALEGLRSMSWIVPPEADLPAVEEYRQAIKQISPDAKPDFASLIAWATAKVSVEALSRVKGPLTRENFVKALETLDKYETGILPPVTFTASKHLGVTELQPVILEKGKWQLVGGFIDPHAAW